MAKTAADYFVSAIKLDPAGHVMDFRVHEAGHAVGGEWHWNRGQVIVQIERLRKTFQTVHRIGQGWKLGDPVRVVSVHGNKYLRVDKKKRTADDLGPLPTY